MTNEIVKSFATDLSRRRRWLPAVAMLIVALIVIGVATSANAEIIYSDCDIDVEGANDNPGQKDLTKMCQDVTNAGTSDPELPIHVKWQWDEVDWSGNNTGDGCSLYDTDADGNADFSLCATISGSPASLQDTRLYSCGDDKPERCTSPIAQITPIQSSCQVDQRDDDPFTAGDEWPVDTVAECEVYLSDIQGDTSGVELIDACSYPSQQPNSDPSDCIIFTPKSGFIEVIKDVEPDTAPGLFTLQIDGDDFAVNVGDGGTTGKQKVSIGTRTISEIAGSGTSLSDYDTTYSCDVNSVPAVITGSGTTFEVILADGDDVICTFTNELKQGDVTACKEDTGGTALGGWIIEVSDAGGALVDSGQTAEVDGCVTFSLDANATYTLTEVLQSGYTQITPENNGGFVVPVAPNVDNGTYTFVNFAHATVEACKVDSEGLAVEGWEITVDGQTGYTDVNGCVTFTLTQPGDYTIAEETRLDWTSLGPTSYNFTAASGMSYGPYVFENYEHGDVTACKVDSEGLAVEGWEITVDGQTGYTDVNGCVTFTLTQPGDYT
ncbi:MAG: hypothetical protein PVG33_11385, partial [Chloroflexota bacterium]